MERFKHYAITMLVALTSITASAYDFEVDGIYYNILSLQDLTCEVTYKHYVYHVYSGDICISSTVTYNGKTFSVTAIGEGAFRDCQGVTSVGIPNSVTAIGYAAFMNCTKLTSVMIPSSVTSIGESSFYGCTSLTSVDIPGSVTEIGGWVFQNCCSLTSMEIPNSIISIGRSAFYGCTSLISVVVPNSVTAIGESSFYGCTGLTSVLIGTSVTEIGRRAFSGCSSLTSFTGKFASEDYRCLIIDSSLMFFAPAGLTTYMIPDSVTSIGYGAFVGCSKLISLEIPYSVTSIGESAFEDCTSLSSMMIPNSVTSIGNSAFSGCTSLTSVDIPNSITTIAEKAFSGCTSLTSIEIPSSVTEIQNWAFEYCSNLTSMVFPNSVTMIRFGAFQNCSSLTSLVIPASITWIEDYAFHKVSISDYVCDNENFVNKFRSTVKNLTLGKNVNTISSLSNWEKLEKITINNNTPPAFSVSSPFTNKQYMDLNIYVPEDAIEDYKKADVWKDFWNLNGFSTNILSMEAKKAVLIRAQGSSIIVSGTERGESIQLYSIDGQQLRNVFADEGQTVIPYNVSKGEVVIVKYDGKAVKVMM